MVRVKLDSTRNMKLPKAILTAFAGITLYGADLPPVEPQPVRLSSWRSQAGRSFDFIIDSSAGRSYDISVSSNLVDWSFLTNVSAAGGTLVVADTQVGGHDRRFYRTGPPTVVENMVFIKAGSFTMGSLTTEPSHDPDE